MKKILLLVLIALSAFIFSIVVNYMGALGINVPNTVASVSNKYQHILTPAGFTFRIWGLIYLLASITLGIWMFKSVKSSNIITLFTVIALLNSLWIIFWVYESIVLSLLVITILLISLILADIEAKKYYRFFSPVSIYFEIYSAWVSLAWLLNLFVVISMYDSMFLQILAMISVIGIGIISIVLLLRCKRVWVSLVIIWGLLGIAVNSTGIMLGTILGTISIIFLNVFKFIKMRAM